MKRRFIVLLMALCLVSTPVGGNEFNAGEIWEKIDRYGIPTVGIVNTLKADADALFSGGNYSQAGDIYKDAAYRADFLAEIMTRCIEPYYNDTSDSKSFPNALSSTLLALENKAHELKLLRNECFVYYGLCEIRNPGNTYGRRNALNLLCQSLNFIESSQEDIWALAVKEIMSIINY